jgi:thermostable 8-oxoguanine DNA glycosylase
MLTTEQYSLMKQKIDKWQLKANKLTGQAEEVLKNLKSEFGVESLDDAKELLVKMKRRYEKAESQFTEEYNQFKEKWDSVLS